MIDTAPKKSGPRDPGPEPAGSFVVTTSRRARAEEVEEAMALARRLGLRYVPRSGPLSPGAGPVVVVTKDDVVIETGAGPLFFHPGMAKPRIAALRQGKRDVMVDAMGLGPGMSVLDGTLGLAADALVASYVVGPTGKVVGVEAVPVLAEVVRLGLTRYDRPPAYLTEAMRRIEVVAADHRQFLAAQPDGAFDVVYFDPFFRDPVQQSVHMRPWRELGRRRPLTRDVIEEALRVARRRVVVKERSDGAVFKELGIDRVVGGKGRRIAYGVLEAGR